MYQISEALRKITINTLGLHGGICQSQRNMSPKISDNETQVKLKHI